MISNVLGRAPGANLIGWADDALLGLAAESASRRARPASAAIGRYPPAAAP